MTEEQFLREQSCDEIQGFLFATPLSGDNFAAFARERDTSALKAQGEKGQPPSAQPSTKEWQRRRG